MSESSGLSQLLSDPHLQLLHSLSDMEAPDALRQNAVKQKKPGKYICHYCGRACAKPSVLKKHIRSHTGERPYPCDPCGFSFKTKSNLYKHRKSHAHAIKAGLVPFADLAAARSGNLDQVSTFGKATVHSDGDQSTDTDEEVLWGSTMRDKGCPVPQISFDTDPPSGGVEPAYADSAEELPVMKVPILIVPKPEGTNVEGPTFLDLKESHHKLSIQGGRRGHSLDDPPNLKHRSALRLNNKKSLDGDFLSPYNKGSMDSGYFSRSESSEQQVSPANTNIKTYEEIMFGRNWYYRPNARSRLPVTPNLTSNNLSIASLKPPGAFRDMGQIGFSGEVELSGDRPSIHIQSSPGLLEPPVESALIRSNSMPTSSPPLLIVPPGIRGSQSFDQMVSSDDVFYRSGLRRLQRQAAIELSADVLKAVDSSSSVQDPVNYCPHGTNVGTSEISTRKRRIEKSVGDEEDSPSHGDSSRRASVETNSDLDYKVFDGFRATGSLQSAHSQSDSFETCASICSEDIALVTDLDGRKAAGNVISVIQHTNTLSHPGSFENSDSFDQPPHLPSGLSSQQSEQSDNDMFEDALSPESALLRKDSMEEHGDNDQVFLSLTKAATGKLYHLTHKLVRQPNIQVPEIRVTEEPDKPEKNLDLQTFKEEKQKHTEEFQLPQRSDTLAQMPSEKLPPKKKRLRLADMGHSSGDSSFESTSTSLSRSPSQESNLSHSSSLSMSFDKEESLKPVSPTKQDDLPASGSGVKQSEFLTVPGSSHSSHHRQREMQRSSSEQAPCALPVELLEMRSKSFDYGSLSTLRQGETHTSASDKKERRRGLLVRQASLSVYPEAGAIEPEPCIKQERIDPSRTGVSGLQHPCDRSRRGGSGSGELPSYQFLQQSISEDSFSGDPLHPKLLQNQLLSPREHLGLLHQEPLQFHPSSISINQTEGFWCLGSGHSPKPKEVQCRIPGPRKQILDGVDITLCGSPSALDLPVPAHYDRCRLGTLVPVRIQTNVPLLGRAMYTSVSQLLVQAELATPKDCWSKTPPGESTISSLNLSQLVNIGIPLTSTTVSITSGSCVGTSKRLLSPTNSMELLFQTRQQKRVREERMYGQILKEMSAVELSGGVEQKARVLPEPERMSSSPPANILVPVHAAPHAPVLTQAQSFTPPLQIVTNRSSRSCSCDLREQLDGDALEPNSRSLDGDKSSDKSPAILMTQMLVQNSDSGALCKMGSLTDVADVQQMSPSLRTSSRVSWCFLNYTKPSSCEVGPSGSVYRSWSVSAYDPNPLNLSTRTALAQLRSKQSNSELLYSTARLSPLGCRKLVSSANWRPRLDQLKTESTLVSGVGRKVGTSWSRSKDDQPEEGPLRPAAPEPARIKIFEGGFKSNEEYVYVRGRGRGKYICEECGIRCKKPSMLKKHIRTHTDVRPFVCRFCNFAFKTKGNLTKHMKSKAHLKKCLELGVSMSSLEEPEDADGTEGQRSERLLRVAGAEHQFSDVDESEGGEDDEVDDEDEEDEDYDGDLTPQTLSRSSSPKPLVFPTPLLTSTIASCHHNFLPRPEQPSHLGYFTTIPSIEITLQALPSDLARQDFSQGQQVTTPLPPASMDEDLQLSSRDFSYRPSSPGLDNSGCSSPVSPVSSPSSSQYLSPHRDPSSLQGHISPRRNLSPLRHVSPKRQDALQRRSQLLLPSPSSTARDYRRDLSPRGRHKGLMRPLSPRRGLHPQSQQSGVRGLRSASPWHHRSGFEPDRGRPRTSSGDQSPPHPVLFSHLPLHSQLQVRSPFPMIPIGGIQMVHSAPTSDVPLSQQKSGTTPVEEPAGGQRERLLQEKEENIRTCTWAIASLCIDSEDPGRHVDSEPAPPEHFTDSLDPGPG